MKYETRGLVFLLACLWRLSLLCGAAETPMKTRSAFYPTELTERAKANAARYRWAAHIRTQIVQAAKPWKTMSDDELWRLMFGSTITRSWMVWSNGFCPACKKKVPMYNWEIDALKRPWKVRCPHCREQFPKNDFHAFYKSGLDEHGVFDPKRADRELLFNTEHPDPKDPLRKFGVDDGEGFVQGRNRWRFIGAYLVYGQWRHRVLQGLKNLCGAYVVTGDPVYARKAGILLDRIADLYPTFDYGKQGLVYEKRNVRKYRGYVSVWHDAAVETRSLAHAYDQVYEGMRSNKKLAAFLKGKAEQYTLANSKSSFRDIQRNIEDRILRDALAHRHKIESNVPSTDLTRITILAVLGWPHNRDAILKQTAGVINRYFRVDGTTGEKGLFSYCAYGSGKLAGFLELFAAGNPDFLKDLHKQCPQLPDGYRFYVDTWMGQQYYPASGDAGNCAERTDRYPAISLAIPGESRARSEYKKWLSVITYPGVSGYSFMWRLYELTGDPAFVQVLYAANKGSVRNLPGDMFARDPGQFQKNVKAAVDKEGPQINIGSVDKKQWHLGILRSGQGENERAVWLDYDSGGNHGHADGMNLGLVAKGLKLMPDLGYKPVQFGGWHTAKANWYGMTAAHNTVVVDGKNHPIHGDMRNPASGRVAGRTTLWAEGRRFRAMRASGARIIHGKQYERTVCLVDVSGKDSYVLDVFRVARGRDHTKFVHSSFGAMTTHGVDLKPAGKYGHGALLKGFKADTSPDPGWWTDWKVEDVYGYLAKGRDIHLRYTDLTTGAQAWTALGWVVAGQPGGGHGSTRERWEPWVLVRRRAGEEQPVSTFVGIIEPYESASNIAGVRRLALETVAGEALGDAHVAVEVTLADGRRDLIMALDVENPFKQLPGWASGTVTVQKDWDLRIDGQLCFGRKDKNGDVQRAALCRGKSLRIGKRVLKTKKTVALVEAVFGKKGATLVAGDPVEMPTTRRR